MSIISGAAGDETVLKAWNSFMIAVPSAAVNRLFRPGIPGCGKKVLAKRRKIGYDSGWNGKGHRVCKTEYHTVIHAGSASPVFSGRNGKEAGRKADTKRCCARETTPKRMLFAGAKASHCGEDPREGRTWTQESASP